MIKTFKSYIIINEIVYVLFGDVSMKETQNYEIHDRLKSKYDEIYQIFIDCRGKTTKGQFTVWN